MNTIRFVLVILLFWSSAVAQAPATANLWRVNASSLTTPPALQDGPLGVSWNPAVSHYAGSISAGATTVHTSDVVGFSGFLLGIARFYQSGAGVGLHAGRVSVKDLVLTTTSPTSEGTIPVFSQFLGVSGFSSFGPLSVGAAFRVHGARFHSERENGLTFDIGARYQPTQRLGVAAATHFLPIDLSGDETTDYYGGIEYVIAPSLRIGSVNTQIVGMYGLTYRAAETLEHMFSTQMIMGGLLRFGASLTREATLDSHGWRASVAVSALIGRYMLEIARSNGLSDLGATYRVGLRANLLR